MSKVKPNYTEFGFSSSMGTKLRNLVEQHLLNDLKFYGIVKNEFRFDWSDSCIEGHSTHYLDGSVENFSGIAVFDAEDNLMANGWMEFIHENNFFLAYWEFVTIWNNDKKLAEKKEMGIPAHVLEQIPKELKPMFEKLKMKENPWK